MLPEIGQVLAVARAGEQLVHKTRPLVRPRIGQKPRHLVTRRDDTVQIEMGPTEKLGVVREFCRCHTLGREGGFDVLVYEDSGFARIGHSSRAGADRKKDHRPDNYRTAWAGTHI